MNERIRELAEESHNEFYNVHIDLELFAELIVRECANQCLSDDCMRILNHMGVKYE
jgi:hypothetical protein